MTRRICVVTGTRAEYGLLYWTLRYLAADLRVTLQLVVTGSHLSPNFGMTVEAIEADGFHVDERVDMLLSSDNPISIAKSMALATIGIAEALDRLKPDLVVVLGDRYEILSVAQVAMLLSLPLAHIHGGEITEGAIDDAIRHAVTKMSHLHFATTDEHVRRIIQMGEDPKHVWDVGSPGVEVIRRLVPLPRAEVEARLGLQLDGPLLLVTYHPVTIGHEDAEIGAQVLIEALKQFPEAKIVFTGVNADPGNRSITRILERFAAGESDRIVVKHSLGSLLYLSTMHLASAVVGNSSSGIIEAPALGVPTVNIGSRQDGRPRAASVIDCAQDADEIARAITKALSPGFRSGLDGMALPYGHGDTSAKIAETLIAIPLDRLIRKRFHDLDWLEEGVPQ